MRTISFSQSISEIAKERANSHLSQHDFPINSEMKPEIINSPTDSERTQVNPRKLNLCKDLFDRWWVLFFYSAFTCLTTIIWNTLNPIASTVIQIYGWNYSLLEFVMFLASIPFCITGIFGGWFTERFGINNSFYHVV